MKTFEIENSAQSMIGKMYDYNGTRLRVLRYELVGTRLKLITDVKDVVAMDMDIPSVLSAFHPIADIAPTTGIDLIIRQTTIGSMAKELKDEAMEAIRNVKKDKSYIPQAHAINEGIKNILEIAKTEIEMFRTIAQINKQ